METTTETLTELGLTHNQARIYVALLSSDRLLTAKEISIITNITRQDVYRILPLLQNIGLAEKSITAPTMFKATPLKLGVSILMENKMLQYNALFDKAKKLSTENENKRQQLTEEQPEFILIPGNHAVIQKINTLTGNVQSSLDIVTSRKRFPRAVFEFFDSRMQSLKRGVKIRCVSEKLPSINESMEEIIAIEEQAGAVTRFLSALPPALITLVDEKEVLIITSVSGNLETSALWSNNPSLVALAKIYFENLWESATIGMTTHNSPKIPIQ
jgi:sugar-specific transcriptional regulator TrmB